MSRKASILIYEDDTVYGQALAASLRDLGHEVQVTDNFEPALTAFEGRSPIDLLLADITVPGGLDGTALARMAQLRQPSVKVIFITGNYVGRVARQIGWPIMQKPIPFKQLLAEVDRALGSD